MKSIRKLKKASKIAAGSALLVGATLTGAAGLASASNHDTNLGDYPTPFVGEDGEVKSTVVVGESAATIDVVGAINVAGSLGQDAYSTTTQTVSGTGGSWSAENGVTLDTTNDDLFFADDVNNVRDTLTGSDLDSLGDSTFRDDSGTEYDITQYVNIGSEQISFGNDPDQLDDEDPELHVTVPAESDVKQNRYLLNLQANIDEIDFTHEDVQGEDIELFGKSFTVSENDNSDGDSELVLYGSSEEVDISSGESSTVTINENEYTLEVVSVTGSGSSKEAAVRVDGELRSVGPSETINVDGQTIRIDEIIRTGGSDSAEGIVNFGIGSEELVFSHGNAIQDEDGDDIEGTYVHFNGGDGLDSSNLNNGISSIDVYLGSEDDDEDALLAGESWSHSMFNDMEFHFGGLNPDARDEGEEISIETSDDETVRTSFTVGEDSQSVEFFNRDTSGNSNELADSDGDKIIAVEGEAVTEDEYFVSDAGDFSHVWEVNSVDRDETGSSLASDAEATVDLSDAVSSSEVEVELEPDGSSDDYIGTEIIDGQTYYFHLDASASNDGSANLYVAWGSGASTDDGGITTGTTTAFPTVETDSNTRVAFYDPSQDPEGYGTSLYSFTDYSFMYIDGDGGGSYEDGDDILSITEITQGTNGADGYAGNQINNFAADRKYMDNDHDDSYDDGEAIIVSSDDIYGSGDSVETAGSADLNNFATGANFHIDADTPANDNYNDGEAVLDDAGNTDNAIDEGDSFVFGGSALVHEFKDGSASNSLSIYVTGNDATLDDGEILYVEDDTNNPDGSDSANTEYNPGQDIAITTEGSVDITTQKTSVTQLTDSSSTNVAFLDLDNDDTFDVTSDDSSEPVVKFSSASSTLQGNGVTTNTVVKAPTESEASALDVSDTYITGTEYQDMSGSTVGPNGASLEFGDSGSGTDGSLDTGEMIIEDNGGSDVTLENSDTVVTEASSASDTDVDSFSSYSTMYIGGSNYADGDDILSVTEVTQGENGADGYAGNEIDNFAANTKHTTSGTYQDGNAIVDDSSSPSGEYDSGDTVITGTIGSSSAQYWSSDSSETSGVSGLNSILPASNPGLVVIEEEADDDKQESYTVSASWDGTDEELSIDSPQFSDSNKRQTSGLESDDDITAGFDQYGVYSEYDSDEQGSFTLNIPYGQSTAGAAVTSTDGSLSAEGGSGSAEINTPTGFPDSAALDSDSNVEDLKESENLILVGGPAVNSLTAELADENQTWSASDYTEGEGIVQVVNNAFTEGQDALVVAGYSGADTRAAANYIADYADNSDDLAGQSQVTVSTQ